VRNGLPQSISEFPARKLSSEKGESDGEELPATKRCGQQLSGTLCMQVQWRRRHQQGASAFVVLLLFIAEWSLAESE